MISVIFFDVGGVYLTGKFTDFVNKAYVLLGIQETFATPEEVAFDSDLNKGKISIEQCFNAFFPVAISANQMKQLVDLWSNTWVLEDAMQNLVSSLKKNYTLAVLSNSDPNNAPLYKKRGWFDSFSFCILSHELGILKPEKEIYEIALKKANVPTNQCLFIDDQPRVLAPAKKLGMKTIHFRSIDQLKQELQLYEVVF